MSFIKSWTKAIEPLKEEIKKAVEEGRITVTETPSGDKEYTIRTPEGARVITESPDGTVTESKTPAAEAPGPVKKKGVILFVIGGIVIIGGAAAAYFLLRKKR